ncbi:MAG: hypothetical protein ACOC2H_04725 [Spirochaetota bacterium]
MKKVAVLVLLCCAGTVYADMQKSDQPVWSVSTHVLNLLSTGVGVEAEYHGFGPIGVFGGGYVNFYDSTGVLTDMSGGSVVGGAKYYFGYADKGLDSFFIGPELQYYTIDQEYENAHHFKQETIGALLLFGKRWMLNPFFIEASVGAGAVHNMTLHADEGFWDMSRSDAEKVGEREGKMGLGLDLKLLAGYSF